MTFYLKKTLAFALLASFSFVGTACFNTAASNREFFGKIEPPAGQVLRYISGSEPESLDPQMSSGQPEARLYMALFEGLVEYHPVTLEPIPAIAERWEVNEDSTEFVFHLRPNARWSNGDPITAHDFVYSLRRGLTPELTSRSAYMAYYVKYAQGFNEKGAFVRDPRTGAFVLEKDLPPATGGESGAPPQKESGRHTEVIASDQHQLPDTSFHQFISAPARLVVPGDEKERLKAMEGDPRLRTLLAGKEFVPVRGEDIGVEAVDAHLLRITLTQPAPFFLGMMSHQFFKVVPRQAIEKHGLAWTQPQNIITSGPFRLEAWKPYHEIVCVRNPTYWDVANVRLERLIFYPLEEATTMMNLYKAGEVDAIYNHSVPVGWVDFIRPLKDYMDAPESAITYVMINTQRPPMNDLRVRKAFNMAIDKQSLARYQKTVKPLYAFSPEGIFPHYPQPKGDQFDPEKAKRLLAEAGYRDASGKYDPEKFPAGEVEYTYNTLERNKGVAEFLQSQWKQNLGITVALKNMEWKTFLNYRSQRQYKGFARGAWISDYMDPYSFLSLFYAPTGDNGTGWWDRKYVDLLDEANRTLDAQARYEKLARAEAFLLEAQPVIPLYTNATNFVKKPYVKGLYPNPMTMHAWKYVYIEHDPAKWDYRMPEMSTE